MISLAVFAFAWAVARASVQAVTGDEGQSYTLYAGRHFPLQWYPDSNNHILNSLLMRLFASVFGVSSLSVRTPALIGAAIYIVAAYWICKLITSKRAIQLPLFVCLVYNPFIFDFFVAARGYGMASAFLLSAIMLPAWYWLRPAEPGTSRLLWVSALSSLFLALSFTASFPFAFVDALSLAALVVWSLRSATKSGLASPGIPRARLLSACLLPGAIVIILIPSYALLHWPKGQIFDGGTSIRATVSSVIDASLFRLNPQILNPLLYRRVDAAKGFLVPALGVLVLLYALLIFFNRRRLPDIRSKRLTALAAVLACIASLTLLLHWAAFHAFGLLMPQHRTAIYFVPLGTLVAGILASISIETRVARATRLALVAMLFVMAGYYFMCLRLTYFREWQYQQDVKRVYDVVAWYNHNRGVRSAEVNWRYHGALIFYCNLSGHETLDPISSEISHPTDKQLYVLDSVSEENFINLLNLKVVYHGGSTDVVVAVRPEFADPPKPPEYSFPAP